MPFINLLARRQRFARMEIHWHVELLDGRPEGSVLRQVVIYSRIYLAHLRESIDQCAAKAQFFNATG